MQKVRCTRGPKRGGTRKLFQLYALQEKRNKKWAGTETEEERPWRIETNISRRRCGGAQSSGALRTQSVEPPRTFGTGRPGTTDRRTDVGGHLNEVLTG